MPFPMKPIPQSSPAQALRKAHFAFCAFILAAMLLRAPALLRVAGNLPLDSPRRAPCLAVVRNVAAISRTLRIDTLCTATESFERHNLE